MSCLRLVPLLLCLLPPLQGLAQVPLSGDVPMAPTTPPPLVSAPDAPEELPQGELIPNDGDSTRGSGSRATRIPVGILLGTVAGAVGAIPGTLLVFETICFDSCSGDPAGVYVGLVLAVGGLIGASALGIDLVGDAMGGQGRFWATALGTVLGALGGLIAGGAVAATAGAAGLIPAILGPAVGGVIAYEISHSSVIDEAAAASASRPRLVPLVSVSPGGGVIGGLAGRF
jgi:hypothetical protein